MSRIWLLPIEPLEERYTAQWLRWWPAGLAEEGHDVRVVAPPPGTVGTRIGCGEFLDVFGTHVYKAMQVAEMARAFQSGEVLDGDVVLLLDGWNPAVTSLAYMRDAGMVRCKLAACLHAGTWDRHDFLSRRGLGRWASHVERGWVEALDAVFVATSFHADLLRAAPAVCASSKLHVTGFPLYAREWQAFSTPWAERERLVVFPHRIAPEKAPVVFELIRQAYETRYGADAVWVSTTNACHTKTEYYALLGRARCAVSCALQETWGIAMLEAQSLGCWPVAPNRLSYPETMPAGSVYETIDDAVERVHRALNSSSPSPYSGSRWEAAIGNVSRVVRSL